MPTGSALNFKQIKHDVREQATPARQTVAAMMSHVAELQQALEKLDVKQAEFLQQSDDLRKKYIQQINNHFDALNTEAINFIHKEAATVRNRKQEAEKSLEAVNSRLQTLEELLSDNRPGLAVQGKKILEELATFQKTPINIEATITEHEMRVKEAKPFNVGDLIILETAQGKTKPFRRDPSGHEFFILRENRWIRQKVTELVNWPRSV